MTVIPYDPSARAAVARSDGSFNADWLLDPAEIAQRIGGTDFVPRGIRNNPAAITAALLYGAEVGLGPMQSLARIAVIDGRPTLAAEAQRALILADGHDLWIEESTNTRCTIAGRRRGSDQISRVTWTLDDAKRARITGRQNWQGYPRQMLLARASAELARAVFADVIGGLAATEELEDVDRDAADAAPQPAAGEPESPKPTTRRRRRVATTSGSSPSPSPTPTPPAAPTPAPARPTPPAPEPEPEAPAEPEPGPEPAQPTAPAEPDKPNRQQLGLLFALFTERGFADRDKRLAWSEQVLGRKISSSKELSSLDVSRLIEALEAGPPAADAEQVPADEQAVIDALETELDARDVGPGEFPEGY